MEIIREDDDTTSGFVITPNQVAQDKTLSLRARGLHQLIRSLPPKFRITSDEIARDWCPEGRDAVRKAMTELVDANIVQKHVYQNERGHWKTEMRVFGKRQPVTKPQVAPTTDFQASVKPPESSGKKTAGRTDDGFSGVGKPVVGSPVVGKPGPIDNTQRKTHNKTQKKTKSGTSVRPEANARETNTAAADGGRTDGGSNLIHEDQPAVSAAAALVSAESLQADLARIDLRPRQRARLIAAVDAALLRFSPERVSRYLAVKAREAQTATYLVGAFVDFSDSIAQQPAPARDVRQDQALLAELADSAAADVPELEPCAEHPTIPRRADGECARCFMDRVAREADEEAENARRAVQPAAADAFNRPGITFVPSRLRASAPLSVVDAGGTQMSASA